MNNVIRVVKENVSDDYFTNKLFVIELIGETNYVSELMYQREITEWIEDEVIQSVDYLYEHKILSDISEVKRYSKFYGGSDRSIHYESNYTFLVIHIVMGIIQSTFSNEHYVEEEILDNVLNIIYHLNTIFDAGINIDINVYNQGDKNE